MMEFFKEVYHRITAAWRELSRKRPTSALDDDGSLENNQPLAKRFKRFDEATTLDRGTSFAPQGRTPLRPPRKVFDEISKKMNHINKQNQQFKRDDVCEREAESRQRFAESHAAASSYACKTPLGSDISEFRRSYSSSVLPRRNVNAVSPKDLVEKTKYNELLLSIMQPHVPAETLSSSSSSLSLSKNPNNTLVRNVSKSNEFSYNPWVQGPSPKRERHSVTKRSDLNLTTVDLTKDEESSSEDISIEYEKIKDRTPRSNSLAAVLKAEPWVDPEFCRSRMETWKKDINKTCQRIKSEEATKKVMSDINTLTNDKYIADRLKSLLIIKESIIEEPEIEVIPQLPELTPEMQDKVHRAWSCRNPNQVLSEGFGLRITPRDLVTLAQLNWLNDEVINFYMNLLMERNKLNKYPKVYAFNTFFYPKLITGGHASLKRWTRKVDIFDHDLIAVPVHLGVHWCMAMVNFKRKTIDYYDSMGHANQKCLTSLLQYLRDESMDKKNIELDTSQWQLKSVKNIPMQMNGSDCGMFACMFAEYLSRGAAITFSQENMPYFRKKVAYEILTKQLLEFK